MTWGDMSKAAVGMAGLTIVIAALIKVTQAAGKDIDKVGPTLLKLSAAMLILAIVLRLIAGMEWGDMGKAAVGITGLVLIINSLIKATGKSGQVKGLGGAFVGIAVAFLALAAVARIISGMSWEDMGKAAVGIGYLSVIISGLIAATKLAGKDLAKVGTTLIAISVAIGILAAVSALLGLIDTKSLIKGITAVGILSIFISGMMAVTKVSKDVRGNFTAIAIAVGVLAAAVAALSFIEPSKLVTSVSAIALLMGVFTLVAHYSNGVNLSIKTMAVMIVVVGLLSGLIYLLSSLDVGSSIETVASISLLLVSMAASLKLMSTVKTVSSGALVGLAAVSAALVIVAAILGVLDKMDIEPSLETATALSELLLAMALVTAILGAISPLAAGAIGAAGAFDAIVVIIGGLMVGLGALMTYVPQCQEFLDTGIEVLKQIGTGIGEFVGSIIDGFLTTATQNLGEVATNLSDFMNNLQPFLEQAKSIDSSVLAGVGYLAGAIAALAAAEFISAIGDLATFWTSYDDLATKLCGFTEALQPFIDDIQGYNAESFTGLGYLATAIINLAAADLISAVSSIVGGGDYSAFGEKIGDLGEGLGAFANSVKGLSANESDLSAAASLATALVDVAGALPSEGGWIQSITGFKDLEGFSSDIRSLGSGLKAFATSTNGMETSTGLQTAVDTATALANVANALPSDGGIWQSIAGFKDLEGFSSDIQALGSGLKVFATATNGMETSTGLDTAVQTAQSLVEVADALPSTGGIWQLVAGEKDLSQFGLNLNLLGIGLKAFAVATNGITDTDAEAAAAVASSLAGVANAIPTTDGIWSLVAGDKDLGKFSLGVAQLGMALQSFAAATNGIGESDASVAIDVAKSLAEVSDYLEPSGFLDWISGDNELSNFGSQLTILGDGLAGFATAVSGMDESGVSTATSVAQTLADITTYVDNGWFNGKLSNFGADIAAFGSNIKKYSENLDGVDQSRMLTVSSAIDILTEALERTASIDTSGVDNFKSSIEKLSAVDIQAFVDAFDSVDESLSTSFSSMVEGIISLGDSSVPSFNEIGGKLAQAISDGFSEDSGLLQTEAGFALDDAISEIDGRVGDFNSSGESLVFAVAAGFGSGSGAASIAGAISSLMASCVSILNSYYGSFLSAGAYVVSGFAAGISANTYRATAQARAMANAAYTAAQAALQVHSPSRLFASLGRWVPEGMAVGISKYSNVVADSSEQMAQKAIDGTKSVIARIGGMLDTDIDATPVISPVMDLSNIQNGVNSITDMLNLSRDVGAISASFNSRSKYDQNYEVVSALNGLRRDIGNMSRPSYNINGITYDDGSNISMAVESLIRAARIERRV